MGDEYLTASVSESRGKALSYGHRHVIWNWPRGKTVEEISAPCSPSRRQSRCNHLEHAHGTWAVTILIWEWTSTPPHGCRGCESPSRATLPPYLLECADGRLAKLERHPANALTR